MIRFGWWSTTLGLAAALGLLVALLLLVVGRARYPGVLLAALLASASLKLMPYVLGFAGFYEVYPWLSFAPFDWGLGYGPLLYLYLRGVTGLPLPRRWPWHFAPLAADIAYTSWAFALPLDRKFAWNNDVHVVWIDPAETWLTLLSLGVYLALAAQVLRRRRAVQTARRKLGWLLTALAALTLWLAVAVGFEVANLFLDLDYYQRFPQYLAFSAIILALALEGWRHGGAAKVMPVQDWRTVGARWSAKIEAEGWWREPGLTLGDAARRLGTNESYLSRACNDGLGASFSTVVNAMRVEAVKRSLATGAGDDLLTIALDAGFASKPSFNRVFKEMTGATPSEWRRREVSEARKAGSEAT